MPSVIPAARAIRAADPVATIEAALALRKVRRSNVKGAMECSPLFLTLAAWPDLSKHHAIAMVRRPRRHLWRELRSGRRALSTAKCIGERGRGAWLST